MVENVKGLQISLSITSSWTFSATKELLMWRQRERIQLFPFPPYFYDFLIIPSIQVPAAKGLGLTKCQRRKRQRRLEKRRGLSLLQVEQHGEKRDGPEESAVWSIICYNISAELKKKKKKWAEQTKTLPNGYGVWAIMEKRMCLWPGVLTF